MADPERSQIALDHACVGRPRLVRRRLQPRPFRIHRPEAERR